MWASPTYYGVWVLTLILQDSASGPFLPLITAQKFTSRMNAMLFEQFIAVRFQLTHFILKNM